MSEDKLKSIQKAQNVSKWFAGLSRWAKIVSGVMTDMFENIHNADDNQLRPDLYLIT